MVRVFLFGKMTIENGKRGHKLATFFSFSADQFTRLKGLLILMECEDNDSLVLITH